jgi:hypothetical protein
VWSIADINLSNAPGFEIKNGKASLAKDSLILLGEVNTAVRDKPRTMTMDNPNLAVFLNLAGYYTDIQDFDAITILIVPQTGESVFALDGVASPKLILDAIAR